MNERVEIAWHTKDIQERLWNPFFHMKMIKKESKKKKNQCLNHTEMHWPTFTCKKKKNTWQGSCLTNEYSVREVGRYWGTFCWQMRLWIPFMVQKIWNRFKLFFFKKSNSQEPHCLPESPSLPGSSVWKPTWCPLLHMPANTKFL